MAKQTEKTDPFFCEDPTPTQKWARWALPILVNLAETGGIITYGDLAKEMGLNASRLGRALGHIGTKLQNLSKEWGEEIPQIQPLAVAKDTKLPKDGIMEFVPDATFDYDTLSRRDQELFVKGLWLDIYAFTQWERVLNDCGLQKIEPKLTVHTGNTRILSGFGGSGRGEGPQHKALKRFILKNPKIVGIDPKKVLRREEEHPLPSGDSIDVYFATADGEVSVEIKPPGINADECERGLYQCIKYQAVLNARQLVQNGKQRSRAVLVLGGEFPKNLLSLKRALNINVVPSIQMPHDDSIVL